jgi:hypothetical protein
MSETTYVGTELELFAEAKVWKSYLARQIAPYLGDEVLEVGAGLGGTTRRFCDRPHARWVCLEPDPTLAVQITQSIESGGLPACSSLEGGSSRSPQPINGSSRPLTRRSGTIAGTRRRHSPRSARRGWIESGCSTWTR